MPVLIQPSFAKGEVGPSIYGRVDTAAYDVALRTARNCVIHPYGGVSNRTGLEFIGPVANHSYAPRLISFEFKTTDAYTIEIGAGYARFIRDDAYITETAKTITGITQANPAVVTSAAHGFTTGQEVFLDVIVGMTRLNGRRFIVGTTTTNTFQLKDQVTGLNFDTSGYAAYVSGGTAARIYQIVMPYAQADLDNIKYTQSADVMTLTHNAYPVQELTRTAHTSWTLTAPTFVPSISAPGGLSGAVVVAGSADTNYLYAVTTINAETSEESLPSTCTVGLGDANTPNNSLSWSGVTGAGRYGVYRNFNGIYGLIGETEGTSFHDSNIEADLNTSPPKARNPFSGSGSYPGTVNYYEQRRVFGGSSNRPDTSEYSQTGNQSNFSRSDPAQDDDAITATLAARQVNEIRHYVPSNDLIVLTSGSEWRINSGADAAFSASTLKQKPQSFWGCSHHLPLLIGNTIIFVEENQGRLRSLGYNLQLDSYTGQDLTILCPHLLFSTQVTDICFARMPDGVAHIVRSDGNALAMTFQQEQQVVAWTHWDTLGDFERVCSMHHAAGEKDDRVYFCVKRKINGNTVRYIERLHDRRFTDVRDAFFVDCGLSYDVPVTITNATSANPIVVTAPAHGFSNGDEVDIYDIEWTPEFDELDNESNPDQLNRRRYTVAAATTDTFALHDSDGNAIDGSTYASYVSGGTVRKAVQTVTGLDHIEGQPVAALCDGNVVQGLTVTNGAVTFSRKFSRIHIGLKYISDVETLDIELPGGGGTRQGQPVKVNSVIVRQEKSRGLFVGPDSFNLDEIKQRRFEDMGDPISLLTGDSLPITIPSNWNSNGRIFIRQRYPLPMTILAVIPDITEGGTRRDE